MSQARVILCEKTGRWAAALRRALGKGSVPVSETLSLSQCGDALQDAPGSLIAVEVSPLALETVLRLIAHARRSDPFARFVALQGAELDSAEPLLREAGAVEVLHSVREAPALALLARRHLALAPRAEPSLSETIAERLPWKRSATPDFAAKMQTSPPSHS
jgi:hypothetical protein